MISPKMNVLDYKWIGLIRDRLDSGLTVVEWCRQHDIRTKTLLLSSDPPEKDGDYRRC